MPSIGNLFSPPPFPQDGDVAWAAKFADWAQYVQDTLSSEIGVDSLDITSDLDAQGSRIVNIGALRWSTTGDPGTALTIWADSGNSKSLYFRDANNVLIPIVANGALAGTPGSITGEFTSAGAAVTYSASFLRYTFLTAVTGGTYADLESAAVRIHLQGGSANAVILKAPPGDLAADLNVVFPPAQPVTTAVVMVDATGTLLYATTPVLQRGQVLSGSIGYTTSSLYVHPWSGFAVTVNSAYQATGSQPGWQLIGASKADFPLPVAVGERICRTDVTVWTNGGSLSASLYARDQNGIVTQQAFRGQSVTTGSAYYVIHLGDGLTTGITFPVMASVSSSYFVRIEQAGGTGSPQSYVYHLGLTKDRTPNGPQGI